MPRFETGYADWRSWLLRNPMHAERIGGPPDLRQPAAHGSDRFAFSRRLHPGREVDLRAAGMSGWEEDLRREFCRAGRGN